jgi:hypothetical protein
VAGLLKYPCNSSVLANSPISDGTYFRGNLKLPVFRPKLRHRLFILAYNLGNFLHRLGLPKAVKNWSLRSLQVKLIKTGGRIVRHARNIVFQLAEVAVPRELFAAILERVTQLRLAPG